MEIGIKDRPIIVCGPARSGTTTVSALLNSKAEILIGRELPLGSLPSLRPLLSETAKYQGDAWTEERRAEVVRNLWFGISRPSRHRKPDARRWGMKTPWAEFDADLWGPLVNPVYVYALRRGDRVFQSHVRLEWDISRSPERLLSRYKESLKVIAPIREAGLAHIVQLDLATDRQSRRRLVEDLFAFLDEEVDAPVERFIEVWPRGWSRPTSEPGEEPHLSEEWEELLAADAEYQELMHLHGYGARAQSPQS